MRSSAQGATDVGRRRDQNEDNFTALERSGLYAVADGLGGHAGGEVASRIFVDTVQAAAGEFEALVREAGGDPDAHRDRFLAFVSELFQRASEAIFSLQERNGELAGMATTGVVLGLVEGRAVLGHVGDSRAYLLRGGEAHQLTVDHTVGQELVTAGTLAPDQLASFPFRHVLARAVGKLPQVRADTLWLDALPRDRFVLCTDGLVNYFGEPAALARACAGRVEDAIAAANAAGGEDNVTAVFVDVAGSPTRVQAVSTEARLRALGDLFLFWELNPAELLKVLKIVDEHACTEGEPLVREGEPGDRIYAVITGQLAVVKGGVVLAELGPGDLFGEIAFLDAQPRSANVVARTASTVLSIQRDPFLALGYEEPLIANKLLRALVARLTERLRNASEEIVGRKL